MEQAVSTKVLAEVEESLAALARRQQRPRVLRELDVDPLNELAKLIADTDHPAGTDPHELLMRALGVNSAPRVKTPPLSDAFFERPFFSDPEFLSLRRHLLMFSPQ